ncbi:MAG: MBL fold metallo-hydrolase [Flavobacteriales bacterium]|nr:MBL fold metallo-hydrolase [Flavobacteriales bacterium]
MLKIQFVNHASYIVDFEDIRLITDPWTSGTAFNDGWNLIQPTLFEPSEFAKITHIWFSHEHPDHFSPSNLKSIPEEFRKNITILYQTTKDHKVIEFCKKLNFKSYIELPLDWYELSKDFKLLNLPHTDGDSWLCIKADGKTILNVNDCVMDNDQHVKDIKTKINTETLDVLFTQFSYANWAGNREDLESRRSFASKKLMEIKRQISVLNPKYTVPFASFVWFCHEENFYMNDAVNQIDDVHDYINSLGSSSTVLFPNDIWTIGEAHDSLISIEKWKKSYSDHIVFDQTIKTEHIDEKTILESGNLYIENLIKANTLWMKFFLKPTFIYLEDLKASYELSLKGFIKTPRDYDRCDIAMSSDSLNYCFKFLWGGATTRINGRYQVPNSGNFYNWKLYFQTSELNNHGEKFGLKFILQSLWRNIKRKLIP